MQSRSPVREFYNSGVYSPNIGHPPELGVPKHYAAVLECVMKEPLPAQRLVVEVGPEKPWIARFVMDRLGLAPSEYCCLDLSETLVLDLNALGVNARSVDVSVDPLPFGTASVDLVLASEVIEHLLDPDRFLREAHRVLKKSGRLILSTPNLASWFNRFVLLFGYQPIFTETGTEWVFGRGPYIRPSRPVGHLHVFTKRAIALLLEAHGFHVTQMKGVSLDRVAQTNRGVTCLDRLFAHFPAFSADLVIVARPQD